MSNPTKLMAATLTGSPSAIVIGGVDFVLFVVQLDVETGHPRVGVPTIGVERLDPLQVRVEPRPVEECLPAPGQLGALARRQRSAQARLVDRVHTDELDRTDGNRAFFVATGKDHK